MKFKTLLFIAGFFLGAAISSISAFATYLIIGVPIGLKMTLQIFLVVLSVAPFIYFLSHYSSHYISRIFADIEERLSRINNQNFDTLPQTSAIIEIHKTQEIINALSFELKKNIEKLQKQNIEKETMLYSIAHDFRTPLTIIKGYIEEFQDGICPKGGVQERFKTIQKEIDFLNELISSVINYLESYQNKKTNGEITLKNLIHDDVLPLLIQKNGVSISIDLKDNVTMCFNRLELRKVFLNLLNNALKFTNKGVICVYEAPNAIIVEDAGIGISEAESEKIFEPFYTTDTSKNTLKTGIGLGLSIVKNLLLKHGYTIVVDTSFTQGARFVICPVSSPYMAP